MKVYDFVIIGGGIYGMYAAKILSRKHKVLLLDADDKLFSRATYINQARLHNGYHYPRSLETAKQANLYFERFQKDFGSSVFRDFDQIYAISKHHSWTTAAEYEEFCKAVGIPLTEVSLSNVFVENSIEKAYSTKEHAFNFEKVLEEMMKETNFEIKTNTIVTSAKREDGHFSLRLSGGETIETGGVLNATYGSLNQVNKLFGVDMVNMKYELCEVVLCKPPKNINNRGITVMDGMLFSIMPFGKRGLYSLWSVKHSPCETSWDDLPKFKCQRKNNSCNQYQLNNCNTCLSRPESLFPAMKERVKEYLLDPGIEYLESLYTVKAISKDAEEDDSRLVYFQKHSSKPYYAHVFSGKINCMYELDKKLEEFL